MKFFNFIKSIFAKNSVTVEVPVTSVVTSDEAIEEATQEVVPCMPTDVLGNVLNEGDYVVRVRYNDIARRGYFTIAENYDAIAYNKRIKHSVVRLDALKNLAVTNGRKHGYLHVATA